MFIIVIASFLSSILSCVAESFGCLIKYHRIGFGYFIHLIIQQVIFWISALCQDHLGTGSAAKNKRSFSRTLNRACVSSPTQGLRRNTQDLQTQCLGPDPLLGVPVFLGGHSSFGSAQVKGLISQVMNGGVALPSSLPSYRCSLSSPFSPAGTSVW